MGDGMRKIKMAVILDPVAGLNPIKDSSVAILLAGQAKGWGIFVLQDCDLFVQDNCPSAFVRGLHVQDVGSDWFQLQAREKVALSDFDVIFMRKDPPFDVNYMYATYFLELAQQEGVLVVNDPVALRDVNEKFFISRFPQCITNMFVGSQKENILAFLEQYKDIVIKPLDGMGGASVFRLQEGDCNVNVVIEILTLRGSRHVMVQKFLPQIRSGDKRILLIDGEPAAFALARIPKAGDIRGNLAAGGLAKGVELSDRDRWICAQLAPTLKEKGLLFVGIDVIGDYLTEINVTSPTCIRELDSCYDLDIAGDLLNVVEQKLI